MTTTKTSGKSEKNGKRSKEATMTTDPVAVVRTPSTSPPGAMPPAIAAPTPPEGWKPTPKKGRGFYGLRPKEAQITNAVEAAQELRSSTFVVDFGEKSPDPGPAAFALTNASKWRDAWTAACLWKEYAGEQRMTWENEAMVQMGTLRPTFEYATSRDTSLEPKYRAMSRFFGATRAIAMRAGASRRRAAAAKLEAAKAAPPAPPDGSGTPAK